MNKPPLRAHQSDAALLQPLPVSNSIFARQGATFGLGQIPVQAEAVGEQAGRQIKVAALTDLLQAASSFFKDMLSLLRLTGCPDVKRDKETERIAIITDDCTKPGGDNLSALYDRITFGSNDNEDSYKVAAIEFAAHVANFISFRLKDVLDDNNVVITDSCKNGAGEDRQVFTFKTIGDLLLLTRFKLFIRINKKIIIEASFDYANKYDARLNMIVDGIEQHFDIETLFRDNIHCDEEDEFANEASNEVQKAALVSFVTGLRRFSPQFPAISPSPNDKLLDEKKTLASSISSLKDNIQQQKEDLDLAVLRLLQVEDLFSKAKFMLQDSVNTSLYTRHRPNEVVKGFHIHNGNLKPETLFIVNATSNPLSFDDKDLVTKVFDTEGFVILTSQHLESLNKTLAERISTIKKQISSYQIELEELTRRHTVCCDKIPALVEEVDQLVNEAIGFYGCVADRFYCAEFVAQSMIRRAYRKVVSDFIYSGTLNFFLFSAWEYIHAVSGTPCRMPATLHGLEVIFGSDSDMTNKQVFKMLLIKLSVSSTKEEFFDALNSVEQVVSAQGEHCFHSFFQRYHRVFARLQGGVASQIVTKAPDVSGLGLC